jgi:hypothetical protein
MSDPRTTTTSHLVVLAKKATGKVVEDIGRTRSDLRRRRDDAASRWEHHIKTKEARRANGLHVHLARDFAVVAILGLATFAMRARIGHQYGEIGLSLSDAGVGLLEPLAVIGAILAMYAFAFVVLGLLMHPMRIAKAFGILLVAAIGFAALTDVVGKGAAGPIAAAAALAAGWLVFVRVSQRVTSTPMRRELMRAGAIVAAVLYLAAFIAAKPATYAERVDGVTAPSHMFGSGLSLPSMFVVVDDGSELRPMVIVDNGAIVIALDPCVEPPYQKRVLDVASAGIELVSMADAMALCSGSQ